MKKRVITGLILAAILLPVVFVQVLVPVFESIIILFAIIAAVEMQNMYDHDKKQPIAIKIVSIIMTLVLYSSLVCNFPKTESTLIYNLVDELFGFHLN